MTTKKLPKNDFYRKMKDFDKFSKIAKNAVNFGIIVVAVGFKRCPKCNKSPNMAALVKLMARF